MKPATRAVSLLVILLVVAAGCRSMTGRSTGQYVDDKKITAEVKTELAAEKLGALDTNQGTVYLTGTGRGRGRRRVEEYYDEQLGR